VEKQLFVCVLSFGLLRALSFLQRRTNAQLPRCSAVQFNLSHRHVSVTLVTIFRVSNSKNTSNMLVNKLQYLPSSITLLLCSTLLHVSAVLTGHYQTLCTSYKHKYMYKYLYLRDGNNNISHFYCELSHVNT
jgi:hypothetical protein